MTYDYPVNPPKIASAALADEDAAAHAGYLAFVSGQSFKSKGAEKSPIIAALPSRLAWLAKHEWKLYASRHPSLDPARAEQAHKVRALNLAFNKQQATKYGK